MTAFMTPVHPTQVPCEQAPEAWFPTPGSSGQAVAAKRLCFTCPVRDACLEEALEKEAGKRRTDRYGIVGGLSPQERFDEDGLRAALTYAGLDVAA